MAKRNMSEKQLANLEKGNFALKSPAERKEIATRGAEAANRVKAEKVKREQANEYIWEKIGVATVDEVLTLGTTQQKLDLLKAVLPKDVLEQKLSGSLDIQKIFITPEEKKETDEHIDGIVAESFKE